MSYLLIVLSAWVLGGILLRMGGLTSVEAAWAYRLAAGLPLSGVLALLGGVYSLVGAQTVLAVVLVCGFLESFYKSAKADPGPPQETPPLSAVEAACVALTVSAILMAFVRALAPATEPRALADVLAVAERYVREGEIAPYSGEPRTGLPQCLYVLYAVALSGGRLPANFLSLTFAVVLCGLMYALGLQLGGRRTAWLSAAATATAPFFMGDGVAAVPATALAAMLVGALAAMAGYWRERRLGWALLSATLIGSACGMSHVGYVAAAILFVAVLAPAGRLLSGVVFLCLWMCSVFPWLLYAWVAVGTPLFPFGNALSAARLADFAGVQPQGHPAYTGLLSLARVPWDSIMNPAIIGGWQYSLGGLVIILGIPACLAGGRRTWSLGLFSLGVFPAILLSPDETAGLTPFLLPLLAAAALAPTVLARLRRPIYVLLVLCFCVGLALHAYRLGPAARVVAGLEDREEYLAAQVPRHVALDYLHGLAPGTILMFQPQAFGANRSVYRNYDALMALADASTDDQTEWLARRNIRYIYLATDVADSLEPPYDRLLSMLAAWRRDTERFPLLKAFEIPRLTGTGLERVEIYQVGPGSEDGVKGGGTSQWLREASLGAEVRRLRRL